MHLSLIEQGGSVVRCTRLQVLVSDGGYISGKIPEKLFCHKGKNAVSRDVSIDRARLALKSTFCHRNEYEDLS
jgi:hypothetical protein